MSKTSSDWQVLLANVVTDPLELLRILELDESLLASAISAGQQFPLRVPRNFVARMKKGDLKDPLLRQVLPIDAELKVVEGFVEDYLAESTMNPAPGLLHKYQARVLLIATGVCAINCRYCFRRHFPYSENNPGREGWIETLEYIAKDPTIHEVILSGGDPLILKDNYLNDLISKIAAIPHVKILRIHSRVPIVLPERITKSFVEILSRHNLRIVLVTHSNHPQEIDDSVILGMQELQKINVTLLNQAVLLRGVNDSVETQVQLSYALFNAGILPYYLHMLDKVKGTAHFEVDKATAQQILKGIQDQVPGYLVPRLVFEQPGAKSKLPVE